MSMKVSDFVKESGIEYISSNAAYNPYGFSRLEYTKDYLPFAVTLKRNRKFFATLVFAEKQSDIIGDKNLEKIVYALAYDLQHLVNKSYSKWLRTNGLLFCNQNKAMFEAMKRVEHMATNFFGEYYPHLLEVQWQQYEKEIKKGKSR